MGRELEQQAGPFDTVVVATGGGGFVGGQAAWFAGRVRVVSVEPATSRCLHAALEAGEPVPVEVRGVAADSLGAARSETSRGSRSGATSKGRCSSMTTTSGRRSGRSGTACASSPSRAAPPPSPPCARRLRAGSRRTRRRRHLRRQLRPVDRDRLDWAFADRRVPVRTGESPQISSIRRIRWSRSISWCLSTRPTWAVTTTKKAMCVATCAGTASSDTSTSHTPSPDDEQQHVEQPLGPVGERALGRRQPGAHGRQRRVPPPQEAHRRQHEDRHTEQHVDGEQRCRHRRLEVVAATTASPSRCRGPRPRPRRGRCRRPPSCSRRRTGTPGRRR